MRNWLAVATCSIWLLVSCCSLPAQTSSSQSASSQPQQCWFTDPTDADNLILAPCDTGVATDKPKVDKLSLVTPKPAQPDVQPSPAQIQSQSQLATHDVGPLTASGWCVIQPRNSNLKQSSSTSNSASDSSSSHTAPGCDVGLGLALFTHNRLSLVSVLGTKTLGIGLALIVVKPSPTFPRVVALALGIVVQYDSSGIYRQVYPALGATMSFRGSNVQ